MLEKHIKLDYEVISPCPNDALQRWETVLTSPEVDYMTLESAVKYGKYFLLLVKFIILSYDNL